MSIKEEQESSKILNNVNVKLKKTILTSFIFSILILIRLSRQEKCRKELFEIHPGCTGLGIGSVRVSVSDQYRSRYLGVGSVRVSVSVRISVQTHTVSFFFQRHQVFMMISIALAIL